MEGQPPLLEAGGEGDMRPCKAEEIWQGIRERFATARQEGMPSQAWKVDADVDDLLEFLQDKGVVIKKAGGSIEPLMKNDLQG